VNESTKKREFPVPILDLLLCGYSFLFIGSCNLTFFSSQNVTLFLPFVLLQPNVSLSFAHNFLFTPPKDCHIANE